MNCSNCNRQPLEQSAFFYPSVSDAQASSKSLVQRANATTNALSESNLLLLNKTQGQIINKPETYTNYTKNIENNKKISDYNKMSSNSLEAIKRKIEQGGRTINIPKEVLPGVLPGPSFNGAITIGEKCVGDYCSIPITPTAPVYASNYSYPYNYVGSYRPGNSSDIYPAIQKYVAPKGSVNYGPFNIEVSPAPTPDNYSM